MCRPTSNKVSGPMQYFICGRHRRSSNVLLGSNFGLSAALAKMCLQQKQRQAQQVSAPVPCATPERPRRPAPNAAVSAAPVKRARIAKSNYKQMCCGSPSPATNKPGELVSSYKPGELIKTLGVRGFMAYVCGHQQQQRRSAPVQTGIALRGVQGFLDHAFGKQRSVPASKTGIALRGVQGFLDHAFGRKDRSSMCSQ